MQDSAVSSDLRPRRRNMRGSEREAAIIAAAIRFFAEYGFEGQTRELAKRMNVSHAVIYRHFPSKEALIERVYEEVYLSRWQPHWAGWILDRSQPLSARLTRFYRDYADKVFDHDWVRIFVFSGLRGVDINARYLAIVRREIIEPATREWRREHGLSEDAPLEERETELFWGLHGRIFYLAIRRFIYQTPVPDNLGDIIADAVTLHMAGMAAMRPA